MALTKRANTWHTDFFVDGMRYRQSLKTSDWREAQKEEKRLIGEAQKGKLAASGARKAFARMLFKDAVQGYIEDRTPTLRPLSVRTERERARAVNRVIGNCRVSSITPEDVLAYVRKRHTEDKRAPATINRELDTIRGVLKRAKRWHLFAEEIKSLPVSQHIGRALLHEEKVRLLRIAATKPAWQAAYYASVLALNTTARGCELKGLRWRDVDFLGTAITITTSKTEAGERVIPLNPDALAIMQELRRRAERIGGTNPSDFVFFACERGHIDPSKPQRTGARHGASLRGR